MEERQQEFQTEQNGSLIPAIPHPTPTIPDSDLEVDDIPLKQGSPGKDEELLRQNQHNRNVEWFRLNAAFLCMAFSAFMLAIFSLLGIWWNTQEAVETFKVLTLTSLGYFVGSNKTGK